MNKTPISSETLCNMTLEAFAPFEHFCKCLLDAYVIIDQSGKVLKANQLFLQIAGKKTKQILKASSLEELIRFEIDHRYIPMDTLLKHPLPTRLDEVRGSTSINPSMNLILGYYPLMHMDQQVGAFLLIRDVTAETALQDKYKIKATQSITDRLTGLYNRFYFDQFLPEIIQIHKEKSHSDQNLSVIMADVDHFKKVNDQFGHLGGDFVLEKIAKIFKKLFRKTDVICRYGGEEFLIILPATNLKESCIAAEKIRSTVETEIFLFNDKNIPITISMGVAQVKLYEETPEEALSRADAALYHAKDIGRNRVCQSDSKMFIEEYTSN